MELLQWLVSTLSTHHDLHGFPPSNNHQRLNELASNCTSSILIVYATICATYLGFFRTYVSNFFSLAYSNRCRRICSTTKATNDRLEDTKLYGNASERQAAHYDRDHPRYPYKSHGQWLKGFYGMFACIILVTFNGVAAFLERPFDVRRFIASYISVCFHLFTHNPSLIEFLLFFQFDR